MWLVSQVCPITFTAKAVTGKPHGGSTPEFSFPEMFLPHEDGSLISKNCIVSNNNCLVKVQHSCLKHLVFESETSRKCGYVVQIPE